MIGWRTPDFWWESRPTFPARLLKPLGDTYGAETAGRMRRRGVAFEIPVITVGAFALGGPGKTPAVEALVGLLIAVGERPAILSRGYGSAAAKQRAPTFVNVSKHSARDVGDEPLLLTRTAPVIVGTDRVEAGWLARRAMNPSVLVLDDGLQSRQIEPDLAIAVVDGEAGIGNGLCAPAGPLRAPMAAQIRHVDAVVVVGPGERGAEIARLAMNSRKRVLTARLIPRSGEAERFAGKPVVAFAGIGRPQKFFAMLQQMGADLRVRHSFADHHMYTRSELAKLQASAHRYGAHLVTTEKDLARLQIQPPHPEEVSDLGCLRDQYASSKSGTPDFDRTVSKTRQTHSPLPAFETRSGGALLRVSGEIDAVGVELVFDDAEAIDSLLLSATQSKAGA
ncbi:MAG: tetraacyldisaccharide 4-kinase [Methylobacteriaceae bacterium]|nr:tetraacyldisaccharide 4-kinase [Methylobacteriaceae bacterium]